MWLDVPGLLNARDLAGTTMPPGLRLRPGVVIRSACPWPLPQSSIELIITRYAVTRVVDLRSAQELKLIGGYPLSSDRRVEYVRRSLTPEFLELLDGLPWEARSSLPRAEYGAGANYLRFLRDRPDSVVGAIRDLTNPNGATLLHCAAGKDRTSVVVALALTILGATRQAVIEDHLLSNASIVELLQQQRSLPYGEKYRGRDPDDYRVDAATLEGLFIQVDREFGGVDDYVRRFGWTDEDQELLIQRLCEKQGEG